MDACTKNKKDNMHLMYGIEWDSTLNWLKGKAIISSSTVGEMKVIDIENLQNGSSSWGNHLDSRGDAASEPWKLNTVQKQGASEYWKANNIYGLSGNVREWTQERYSTESNRSIRGGGYYRMGYPVAIRFYGDEEYKEEGLRISC